LNEKGGLSGQWNLTASIAKVGKLGSAEKLIKNIISET
jgi:hypothetical protein